MKKTYIQPSAKAHSLKAQSILAASGGVSNGSSVGNDYNKNDISYGKRRGTTWDDDEEDY